MAALQSFTTHPILDDTAFMIDVDPLEITADVLDAAALVPVSMCTPDVDAKVLDGAAIAQICCPRS
jgi:hypothetical protein